MLRQNAEKNKPLLAEPTPTTVFQPAFTANHLRFILEYIVRTHKHRHKYYELYITDNKKGKNLTKTCTNVPSTNNTLRHERNSFQIKLSHSILVRKKGKKKQMTRNDKNTKQNKPLKQKKKNRVADELTDKMKHYLLYVTFILRNQVKAPPVIMDGRLGCPLFCTTWFWLRWL